MTFDEQWQAFETSMEGIIAEFRKTRRGRVTLWLLRKAAWIYCHLS